MQESKIGGKKKFDIWLKRISIIVGICGTLFGIYKFLSNNDNGSIDSNINQESQQIVNFEPVNNNTNQVVVNVTTHEQKSSESNNELRPQKQQNGKLYSGTVLDKKSNEPISGVEVTILKYSSKTDSTGKFEIECFEENEQEGDHLVFAKIGYETFRKYIHFNVGKNLGNISLQKEKE